MVTRPRRTALPLAAAAVLLAFACSPEERAFTTTAAGSATGAGGAGTGGAAGPGGGAECPGETIPCYTGPQGTQGVGICKAGEQACEPDVGGVGPCEGEIVPAAEDCATPDDEDCDEAVECGEHLWSKIVGDPSSQYGNDVIADADGNVIVVGGFGGTVDFGKDAFTSAGADDIFVAKLAPNGDPIWARRFGGASSEAAASVAVDAKGEIFVAGNFQGTVDFGSGPIASAGLNDIFLLKLGQGGVTLWSKGFGDATNQLATDVAVDPAGNVVLVGSFAGTVNFGTGALMSGGSNDVYVAKFSPMGQALWAKGFGDAAVQSAQGVATDAAGNIVIAGHNSGGVSFGGGFIASQGGTDVFVAKLDAGGGAHIWSAGFGDPGLQNVYGVGVDAKGDVTFAGRTAGDVDFGGGFVKGDGNGEDFFVVKLDASGKHVYSVALQTDSSKQSGAVNVDADGNALVTGWVFGTVDLGFGPVMTASDDAFVVKLDAQGKPVWGRIYGDDQGQEGRGIAAGPQGFVLVTGSAVGSIDFGGGPLVSAGGSDAFLAKLAP
jgi:hypothetical protein